MNRRTAQRTARRTPSLLAATAPAPVLLAGCFAGPDQAGSGTGGAGRTTADGKEVSLAMLLPPRSALTPFSDDAFKLSRWSTAETLVVLDDAGDAQPALSTSWAQVDDLTWRSEVRQGVTFHDGTDLTVISVVDALTAAIAAAPKPRILDGVELVVEPDADAPEEAVLVRTAVPQRLSSPQLSILASSAYGEDGVVDPIGAGTGAFVLTGLDGTSSATLDRYDDYRGAPAAAAGIDVDFVPDGTARAAALRTGEADVVEAIPVSQAGLLEEDQVFEVPMPRTNTLYLNTGTDAFTDLAVRAAAREVIDHHSPAGRHDVVDPCQEITVEVGIEHVRDRREQHQAEPARRERRPQVTGERGDPGELRVGRRPLDDRRQVLQHDLDAVLDESEGERAVPAAEVESSGPGGEQVQAGPHDRSDDRAGDRR